MSDHFGEEPLKVYDTAEPILAYKWWSGGWHRLWGANALTSWNTVWPRSGEIVAECKWTHCARSHDASEVPVKEFNSTGGYGCGIYAYKDMHHGYNHSPRLGYLIYGQVLLAGRIAQHEHGYRAEKAKVVGIYDLRNDDLLVYENITHAYGIPLLEKPPTLYSPDQSLNRLDFL